MPNVDVIATKYRITHAFILIARVAVLTFGNRCGLYPVDIKGYLYRKDWSGIQNTDAEIMSRFHESTRRADRDARASARGKYLKILTRLFF